MKYEKEVMEIMDHIARQFYEDWMDDNDIKEFLDTITTMLGEQMDRAIQEGLAMGYSLETQMDAMLRLRYIRCDNGDIKLALDQPGTGMMVH